VITGLAVLLIYAVAIPWLFSYASSWLQGSPQLPLPLSDLKHMAALLALFISLETASAAAGRGVYGFLISAVSKLIGLVLVVGALGSGKMTGEAEIYGSKVFVSLDVSPLLYFIVALTFAFIVLSSLDAFKEE